MKDLLTCPGDGCRLRLVCYRFIMWMVADDDDEPGMLPAYKDGDCSELVKKEFYGG